MVVRFNRKVIPNIVEAAKDSITDSNTLIYEEVLHLVQDTAKNGIVYPFRGGVHQASAPGEPFANMTGNALLNTKQYEENGRLRGRVAGEAEYAAYLELGTSRMDPRPVFRPAIVNKSDEIIRAFKTNIREAIKKS